MGLRLRTILTLLAVVLPMIAAFTAYRFGAETRLLAERRVERIAMKKGPRLAKRCLRHPKKFGIDRVRYRIWSYHENFKSKNRNAPEFPKELKILGEDPMSVKRWFKGERIGFTAQRVNEGGACSVLLFEWKSPTIPPRIFKAITFQVAVIFLILIVLGLVIAAPLVRRIRRIERDIMRNEGKEFDLSKYKKKDELDALARVLGKVLQQLSDRDIALKDYVANTTHDLMTPITVLQHRLRRLQNESLEEEAEEIVQTLLEESHYIASLIANMGAVTRLDSARVFSEIDLGLLVSRIVNRHRPIASAGQVELEFAIPMEPLLLQCDETLVERAISNIVQNAIQYNMRGGHVSVVLERFEILKSIENEHFELSVIDDGPGVNPTLLPYLATRSIRSDEARNRNPGGAGFGLSIAKEVANLQGWTLAFENLKPGFKVVLTNKEERTNSSI